MLAHNIPNIAERWSSVPGLPNIPLNESMAAELFKPTQFFSLTCLFVMIVIASFLYGMFLMLLISYIYHVKEDSWWIRGTVLAVTSTITITIGFNWYLMNFMFIANYGLYEQLLATDKFGYDPLMDVVTTAICQVFFTHRAFRLTGRNYYVLFVLAFLILTSVAGAVGVTIVFVQQTNELYAFYIQPPELVWLTTAMVADVIITVCILYGLWKSRTGWSNTDRVISRLIRMTLEAQVPPLIFAIGYLSYVSQEPSSLLGAVFLGCQPYIYGICLLYTLNSRQRWKDNRHMTMVSGETFQLRQNQAATIKVDVETEMYESRIERPIALSRGATAPPASPAKEDPFEVESKPESKADSKADSKSPA